MKTKSTAVRRENISPIRNKNITGHSCCRSDLVWKIDSWSTDRSCACGNYPHNLDYLDYLYLACLCLGSPSGLSDLSDPDTASLDEEGHDLENNLSMAYGP